MNSVENGKKRYTHDIQIQIQIFTVTKKKTGKNAFISKRTYNEKNKINKNIERK